LLKKEHTELCRATLPVSVQGFYNMFCNDDTREFLKVYHDKRGDSEFQCTQWKDTELGSTREISIRAPVTGAPMLAPDSTRVFKTQRKQFHGTGDDQVLVFDTSQSMSDIPYGDYFILEERWIVRPYADSSGGQQWKGCEFIASANIKFHKYTMFKGVIVARAKKDIKEANDLWVTMCTEHLQSSNDPREPISQPNSGSVQLQGEHKKGHRKSPNRNKNASNRRERGRTNSHVSKQRSSNNSNHSNSSTRPKTPSALVTYSWMALVLALLVYLCRETMLLKAQMKALEDKTCLTTIG
jgi:hypothetical protein